MTIVSVYAVFANSEEAATIGNTAVEERLAACVNILGSVHSIYRWKGTIERSEETIAIFKTSEELADQLIARIASLHSYEVPCIATWPIDKVLEDYAAFVEENVGQATT